MKVGVIGAVGTTKLTLQKLLEHNFNVVGVLGHEPKNILKVSGIHDLSSLASAHNLDYRGYRRINDAELLNWMRIRKPEIIFAVGFSQLLKSEWLNLAPKGCVGFHPTQLPKGRGRAPIAWLILEQRNGAASFFKMGEGADDGPIFVQEPFEVTPHDDAESLIPKVQNAISSALDTWLPKLKKGDYNPVPQKHEDATEYGKRDPADGQINWSNQATAIDRLIKASCRPHPGAFTSFDGSIVKVWKSKIIDSPKVKGVQGRVLKVDDKGVLVQTGEGCLLITEYSSNHNHVFKVGNTLEWIYFTDRRAFNQIILES